MPITKKSFKHWKVILRVALILQWGLLSLKQGKREEKKREEKRRVPEEK